MRVAVRVPTLPLEDDLPSAVGNHVYVGKRLSQLGYASIGLVLSLGGLTQIPPFLRWYHGDPSPGLNVLVALSFPLFFSMGLVCLTNAIRGLPRLSMGPRGVTLQQAFGSSWADWDSIDPFVVQTTSAGRRQVKRATARITGPNAGKSRSKLMSIPNVFDDPIEQIVAEINALRSSTLGIGHISSTVTPDAEETPIGLAGFAVPWLSFVLLAVLIGVFVLENELPVTPVLKGAPSLPTLVAMGALSHSAVLGGEWYRLFTAPLLHANFAHLAGNGVALLLGGWLFERLVGRLWFFAIVTIGALGGSFASLALQPANLISVGASGALMGMFAGLFVCSFRIGSESASRIRLQINSLRILVPSLLPSFSGSTTVHVDYGAHFGGALAGAALALVLLRLWPKTSAIPQARMAAAILAAVGAVLFIGSAGIAAAKYPEYKTALRSIRPATTSAPKDGGTTDRRAFGSTPEKFYPSLGKCKALFPTGGGAAPGINCTN